MQHVEEADRICEDRVHCHFQRGGLPRIKNLKSFAKAKVVMRDLTPERYRICECTIQRGKRAYWFCMRLAPLRGPNGQLVGLTFKGYEASTTGRCVPFDLSLRITPHAIARMIQRSETLTPPFNPREVDPLYAEFNLLPLWFAVALYALVASDPTDPIRHSLLLPAENGVFVGSYSKPEGIVIKTYVGDQRLWEEQALALNRLRAFHEGTLAAYHAHVRNLDWNIEVNYEVIQELSDIWHKWISMNQRRRDRPSRDDRAWEEHRRLDP